MQFLPVCLLYERLAGSGHGNDKPGTHVFSATIDGQRGDRLEGEPSSRGSLGDTCGTHVEDRGAWPGFRTPLSGGVGVKAGLEVRVGILGWDHLPLDILWIEELIFIRFPS